MNDQMAKCHCFGSLIFVQLGKPFSSNDTYRCYIDFVHFRASHQNVNSPMHPLRGSRVSLGRTTKLFASTNPLMLRGLEPPRIFVELM